MASEFDHHERAEVAEPDAQSPIHAQLRSIESAFARLCNANDLMEGQLQPVMRRVAKDSDDGATLQTISDHSDIFEALASLASRINNEADRIHGLRDRMEIA